MATPPDLDLVSLIANNNVRFGTQDYAELACNFASDGVLSFRQGHVDMPCLGATVSTTANVIGIDPLLNNRLVLVAGGGGGTGGGDVFTSQTNTYAPDIENNFNGGITFTAGTTTNEPATVAVMNSADKILSVSATNKLVFNNGLSASAIPQVALNQTAIQTNLNSILVNTGIIQQNQTDIALNTGSILSNDADILQNQTDIALNAGNILANTQNISQHATVINQNASDIATNTGNISTNMNNINTNGMNISTNTGDILTNTANISTNTGDILTNTANISTNTGNITTNTTDIATNTLGVSNSVKFSAPSLQIITSPIEINTTLEVKSTATLNQVNIGGALNITLGTAPPLSASTGTVGEFRLVNQGGSAYIYVCVATNIWGRSAIIPW